MPKKSLLVVALVLCPLLFVMGALKQQTPGLPQPAGAPFLAQPGTPGTGLDQLAPAEILALAASRVAPAAAPWLQFSTWQKQADGDLTFEAEGRVIRGPNHCARLEMTVRRAGPAHVLVVSDGAGLAQRFQLPGQAPEIVSQRFMTTSQQAMPAEEIDKLLSGKGCGGPHGLLEELERVLEKLTSEVGIWNARPILRISGEVKDEYKKLLATRFGVAPSWGRLYLDGQTLWPCRVEWWAARGPEQASFNLLQIEFRDPVINRPLSHEDCVRAFTFLPD